jgi:hypothetical protein
MYRSKNRSRRSKLKGGKAQCLNRLEKGIPIDPISLAQIPLNRLIRVPVSFKPFPYEIHPQPGTDYYCFDRDYLLRWLNQSPKNPSTGLNFSYAQAHDIYLQLKQQARKGMKQSPFNIETFPEYLLDLMSSGSL